MDANEGAALEVLRDPVYGGAETIQLLDRFGAPVGEPVGFAEIARRIQRGYYD